MIVIQANVCITRVSSTFHFKIKTRVFVAASALCLKVKLNTNSSNSYRENVDCANALWSEGPSLENMIGIDMKTKLILS